jgi:hypothetical protein
MERLEEAVRAYGAAFGHSVPSTVTMMFSTQPGPLVNEIRQAIALGKPVPAWLAHAKRSIGSAEGWSAVG